MAVDYVPIFNDIFFSAWGTLLIVCQVKDAGLECSKPSANKKQGYAALTNKKQVC
jgi:hypothetical protein